MDIKALIDEVNAKSVKTYLRRQQLEMQIAQYKNAAAQTDVELIKLDGELEVLERLAEIQKSEQEKQDA